MAYRYHSKAFADSTAPQAWGTCDRCNQIHLHRELQWQWEFNATGLYNKRLLVCGQCLDQPQPQFLTPTLPPDPMPVQNPRPWNYAASETGYTQPLQAQIYTSAAAITSFYLDLFDGDPAGNGQSVLSSITGTATRTDFATSMGTPVGDVSTNTAAVTFTTQAEASVDVSHLAVYDAATGGNLVMSGPLLNPMTVVLYNGAAFPIGNLQVWLNQ